MTTIIDDRFAMMVVRTIVKNYYAPGYREHVRKCECSQEPTSHQIFVDDDGPGEFCTECGMSPAQMNDAIDAECFTCNRPTSQKLVTPKVGDGVWLHCTSCLCVRRPEVDDLIPRVK